MPEDSASAPIVEQYTYKIFWSDEDQEWVGVCAEFGAPLSWLDPDKQAAERGIRTLVRESIEILEEHGESIPVNGQWDLPGGGQ